MPKTTTVTIPKEDLQAFLAGQIQLDGHPGRDVREFEPITASSLKVTKDEQGNLVLELKEE